MKKQENKITYDEARQYWQELLGSGLQEMTLDYDCESTNNHEAEPKKIEFAIKEKVSDTLISICKNSDIMLYVYLTAAYEVMLYLLTGMKNICLGIPSLAAGPNTENLAILTRSTINPDMSYRDFLNTVKKNLLRGYQNQSYPMREALIEADCPTSYQSFVKYVVSLNTIHSQDAVEDFLNSLDSDFVISFTKDSALKGVIKYKPNRVSGEFLQTLSKVYLYIIDQTLDNLDKTLKEILAADNEEMDKLSRWNDTGLEFEEEKTIDLLFQNAAVQYAENTALVYVADRGQDDFQSIDYETLNRKSNQLAHILLNHGLEKGAPVGVLMSNSMELIISMLGIMKAGGAFLPMDIGYPAERVHMIAKDVKMKLLLTNQEIYKEAVPSDTAVLRTDMNGWQEVSDEAVCISKTLEDTAYILYTSGSTGTPKGVRVSHKNFLNFILWRIQAYQYSEKEVSLQLISPAFDGSLTNVFPALLSGGSCVFVHNDLWREISFVNQVIKTHRITNFSIVPTMYRMLAEQAGIGEWDSLRFIVLAGETTKPALIHLTQEKFPHVVLMNEYGPTEATITAAAKQNMNANNCNCIGRPIANTSVYILNEEQKILPAGFTGELCIAGAGVVSGYIGRNEESQEKFIVSPFKQEEILYRTGDNARWNQNGELEYLGRKDRLVKLHGLRIELDEITSILLEQDGISDAYVWIYKENNREELVGVVETETELDLDSVKDKLRGKLPSYMVPGMLKQVTSIPVNCNGKIATDALNGFIILGEDADDTEVLNDTELFFKEIWTSLLHRDNFNINSNFFDIGGNSMLIMLMHNEVEKKYPGTLTIPDYFTCFTIKKLAETVNERNGNK